MEEGSYDQRNFSNWSMGFKNLKDKDLKELPGFLELTDENFGKIFPIINLERFNFLKASTTIKFEIVTKLHRQNIDYFDKACVLWKNL